MAEMKFEEALKKLERIVSDLEKENISLDAALKKFEEGIKLSRYCTKKIKEIENKIEILMKDEDGKFARKPFKIKGEEE